MLVLNRLASSWDGLITCGLSSFFLPAANFLLVTLGPSPSLYIRLQQPQLHVSHDAPESILPGL